MHFPQIHFIINPAAGQENSILPIIQEVFSGSNCQWGFSLTRKKGDAVHFANEYKEKVDLLVACGGDGTMMEVAQALYQSDTPMAIIPGGTANVMAKEIHMPLDALAAIELLKSGDMEVKCIDMGLVNETPFLLRVNFGIMADMIIEADRELKQSLGQLAYGVTALQTLAVAESQTYHMCIDGEKVTESGVSLTVTNSGNIGIEGFSFLPGISITDGLLDVILLNEADALSVARIAGSTLFQTDSEVLKHWRCKEISIATDFPTKVICDDCEHESTTFFIKALPSALRVAVPRTKQ